MTNENAMSEAQDIDSVLWLREDADFQQHQVEHNIPMVPSVEDPVMLRAAAAEIERLRERLNYRSRASTHSDECWRWHPDCAERVISETRAERDAARAEVERLTKDLSETTLAWATAADDRDNYSGLLAATRVERDAAVALVDEAISWTNLHDDDGWTNYDWMDRAVAFRKKQES